MTVTWLEQITGETFALIIDLAWPMLVAAVLVGVIIAVFQAATQVQEQSLSFVPKILATFYVVYLKGPYINQTLQKFLYHRLEDVYWIANGYKH